MQKTTFKISKMDCPSEEQMIRLKLEGQLNINDLQFDIPNRMLDVYHTDSNEEIYRQLDALDFGTSLVSSEEVVDYLPTNDHDEQRRLLWQVLLINFFFFVLEIITGFVSGSVGLIADSLDMLADSIVYGLALFAVGGTLIRKRNIARSSGYFQLMLAFFGFGEVIRHFIWYYEAPEFQTMIIISVLALIGNALCLYLLQKSKSKESHIQASMIFTSNDVIVNIGVIIAGVLVYLTASKYPDLIIGTIVFTLVSRGAFRIIKLS